MFFDKFFKHKDDNSEMSGGAANLNIEDRALTEADFSEDDDFFVDIESWGERIAIK